VVAVWIGNFDGRANGTFVGRIAAAPLLFQIIDSLRATWPEPNQPHLPPPGANLKRVSFCAVSGDLPEPYCAQQIEGWFIPGISPIKLCDVHQEVLVDAVSGLRVPRDDGYIANLSGAVTAFQAELAATVEAVRNYGQQKAAA